eukprot:TRINITY_DN2252_c0_g1_i2.p1 TRINITY_DN2252_c0_g1~~TRINITY_DN2252_c0_g1_i2.p1  ORF type:complete len:405 (-),score=53.81 TRINITY_DN2252_c0_g1_i2:3496-4710(-)
MTKAAFIFHIPNARFVMSSKEAKPARLRSASGIFPDLSPKKKRVFFSDLFIPIEWYDEAFGCKKDMMRVRFSFMYVPGMQAGSRFKEVTVSYEYTMNDELKEEYEAIYKDHFGETITLNRVSEKELVATKELPHGRISKCEFKENEKLIKDDPDQGIQTIVEIYPKVKSEADRRKDKEAHENELQNREIQLKNEHLKAKENKRKQEEEKERIKVAMSKITDKLGEVWKQIDHSFVTTEEDESECVYLFSIHYEELYPIYQAYARQVPQFCISRENEYILLQHFFHFLKEYGFGCGSMEELYSLLASLSPLIEEKVVDSLNLYNGLNFAGFIEAILRIAYIKAKTEADEADKLEESKDFDEPPKQIRTSPPVINKMQEYHRHQKNFWKTSWQHQAKTCRSLERKK